MESHDIYQFLTIIEGEPSKNAKIYLLEEFLEDPDFNKVVKYAYNPFITFGVLKLPDVPPGSRNFTYDTWVVLDMLANRELTGNDAKNTIFNTLQDLNKESQILFKNILNKDLRSGFSVLSINKAMKGLIPIMPYMRCSLPKEVKLEKFHWEEGVESQPKMDGMFVNVNLGDLLQILTRIGQRFPDNFNRVCSALKHLKKGYQYHGEFIAYKDMELLPRKLSNGLMNKLLKGGTIEDDIMLQYVMWDMIPLDAVQSQMAYNVSYMERYLTLLQSREKLVGEERIWVKAIDSRMVHSFREAQEHFLEVIGEGGEGTVFKDSRMPWKNGTSKWQVKLKSEKVCELRVIGYIPGNGRLESTFGSLICISEEGDIEVNVSGFTDAKRKEIWESAGKWLDTIIGVKFNEVIDDKTTGKLSLFLPRFDGERPDKDTADTADRIVLM